VSSDALVGPLALFDRQYSIVSIRSSLFDRHCSIVTVRSSLFDRLVIPTPKAEESATPRSCGASEDLNHRSAGHARPSTGDDARRSI